MASSRTGTAAISIDLSDVHAPKRPNEWRKWIPAAFPGVRVLSVERRPVGIMSQVRIGPMDVTKILNSGQRLGSDGTTQGRAMVGLILQSDGVSDYTQDGSDCRIGPGEFCLIDDARPFTVESHGISHVAIIRIPREQLVGRFPILATRTAQVFPIDRAETIILRDLLRGIVDQADSLADEAGSALVSAIVALLASLPLSAEPVRDVSWRIKRALTDIEARLDDPTLTATDVAEAQSIGRRQLDALFTSFMKSTVTMQIVERRLAQTAQDLCDPGQRSRRITDIAFAAGFSDSAHFTRTFRRRFGLTPREWRNRTLA